MAHSRAFAGQRGFGPVWSPPIPLAAQHGLVEDTGRDQFAATAAARMALREAVSATTEAADRALSLAALLDETLAALADFDTAPPRAPSPSPLSRQQTGVLSARERQVLALLTEGHSNKAIAEALFVSPNTVKTHVASLLHKLHAGSRAQLAAIAIRQGLHRAASSAVVDPVSH